MSYGNYQQYGSNPYASDDQQGGYGYGAQQNPYSQGSNPYGSSGGYGGSANPYGQTTQYTQPEQRPVAATQPSGYSTSNYSAPGYQMSQPPTNQSGAPPPGAVVGTGVLSNQDFLSRVEGVKADIRQLTANVQEIGTIHQRVLGTPDASSSAQLSNMVSQTQILNTKIKDQIKQLEADAARSKGNQTKDSQIRTLKQSFTSQLQDYQREETTYRQRYKEQIARQYRIVNPEASESEVQEATQADWGDEGVFQTALKSNRSGAATSVLGAVRARHNDIQQIERTLIELQQLFQDLAEQVIVQEPAIQQTEQQTENVKKDTEAGNAQLVKGIKSARNRRKLKWWCFGICVLIIVIIALAVGLHFGVGKGSN